MRLVYPCIVEKRARPPRGGRAHASNHLEYELLCTARSILLERLDPGDELVEAIQHILIRIIVPIQVEQLIPEHPLAAGGRYDLFVHDDIRYGNQPVPRGQFASFLGSL